MLTLLKPTRCKPYGTHKPLFHPIRLHPPPPPLTSLTLRPASTTTPRPRRLRTLLTSLTTFLSILSLLTLTKTSLFELRTVSGASMHPFLNADHDASLQRDVVWVRKWRAAEDVRRGMVVAFYSPNHPDVVAVKRVVAVEGDVVVTKEPYPREREEVPVGHVWVEGDVEGRGKSFDSNYYGPVSKSLIEGQVTHVVWPVEKRCRIRPEDWKGSPRVLEGRGKVEKIKFY